MSLRNLCKFGRYRERKYNSSENDRLLRALSQPVQAWDKKWTSHADTKKLSVFKWVKSDRTIHFEPDEESDEEPVEMDQDKESLEQDTTKTPSDEPKKSDSSFDAIPGGRSSLLQSSALNKTVSTLQMEDDERSHTPNLDDISDVESDRNLDDDNDNDVDSVSDPSKHPALAPHAQAHMTDDDMMTDSSVATPADERADQVMEEVVQQHPHPLSQEPISAEPMPPPPTSEEVAAQLESLEQRPLHEEAKQTTQETPVQEEKVVDDPMQEDHPETKSQQEETSMEVEEKPQQQSTEENKTDKTNQIAESNSEPTQVIIQEPTQESTQEITLEPAQQEKPQQEKTVEEEASKQEPVTAVQPVEQKEGLSEKKPAVDIPTFDSSSPKNVAAVADSNTTVGLSANVEAIATEEKIEPVPVVTDEQQFKPMEE